MAGNGSRWSIFETFLWKLGRRNNAGIRRHLELTDEDRAGSPDDSLRRELDVNLRSADHLTTLAMQRPKATAACGGTAVVFVTSALALTPKASAPVYCASKAGLRSFAKAIRHQLLPYMACESWRSSRRWSTPQ